MANKLTGSAAAEHYFQNEQTRSSIRQSIMEEAIRAKEVYVEGDDIPEGKSVGDVKGLNEEFLFDIGKVYESIPYTYAELGYNQQYINLLKEKYFLEHDKKFKGAGSEIKHLIDEDFADWNFVMNNLSLGMGSEILKNLAFASDEERANALARWKVFTATPAFDSGVADDSRPFLDIKFAGKIDPNDEAAVQRAKDLGWMGFEVTGQLGDFIKGAGTDPLAWLLFGSGVGFGGKKLIEKGVSAWLAPKLALATAGGTFAGIHDVGRQMVEKTAGGEKEYDPIQTLKSMGLGFAIAPALTAVGKLAGPVGRAITHPGQSLAKGIGFFAGSKSEMAAAQGVMQQAEQKFAQTGQSGKSAVTTGLKDYLAAGYNAVDNYFNVMFDSIKSAPVKEGSITGLVERWNGRFGDTLQLSASWENLLQKYIDGEAAYLQAQSKKSGTVFAIPAEGQGLGIKGPHYQELVRKTKRIPLIDLARQLRREFHTAGLKDKKDNLGANMKLIGEYKDTINNIINKAVKKTNPELAAQLDKSYSVFKAETSKNPYGKDLLAMAHDGTQDSATKFFKKMLKPDFSWEKFNAAIKHFQKLDHIVGNKKNELAGGLRTKIEKGMAQYIMQADDGAKILSSLVRSVDGRKTLDKVFPSMKKQFDDIAYMQKHLGSWGGAESVIGNMAMARLGAMTGQQLAGTAGGLIGGVGAITQWNRLINSQYFKDAMVHAYKNNGGTLETSTRNWLMKHYKGVDGKKGLTIPQINAIQDTMWGYMYAGYALHGEDVLQERTGNKALDALNDLRVQYEHIMPEVRNLQLSSY